jgi:hypothetical protein
MPVSQVWLPVLIAIALLVAVRAAIAWLKYRGRRVVACPENSRPAGVQVDATRAALNLFGKPDLHLSSCSRWPERAGCGQQCLSQIEASPDGCLVRNMLVKWYEGKDCVSCGKPFGKIDWNGAKPALLRADKKSVDWNQVAAEELPETLSAALPVCFACHMAITLVREHPDLVTDRSSRAS